MRTRFVRLSAILLALSCASSALALDPSRSLTQYVHRIWQVQQGLPQASIYSIVQTRDGYLWLGTETGLVRFDGARFTTFDELNGLSSAHLWITHLLEDDQSALWIGTTQAGLIRWEHGAATRYTERNGLPSDTVQCLFADRHGNTWACTPNGLVEISRGKVRVLGTESGLSTANVQAACTKADDTLVVATSDRKLTVSHGAGFISRPLALPESASVQALLCASNGTIWIGTSEGLILADTDHENRLTVADGLPDNFVLTLTESHDGGVLVGTKNGFSRIRGSEIDAFRPQDGLSQSSVYSLFEDREGSLWAATKHGLNQFLDGRAIPFTTSEGLPSNNTGPVLEDSHGTMWVGTLGGGLSRFDGHRFVTLTTRDGLASNIVHALAEDAGGDLWVGTDAGLNRLRDGRVISTWTTRQGLPSAAVHALFRDHAGAMWIATSIGAAVFRNGSLRPVTDLRRTPTEPILAFAEDRNHQLYAAPETETPLLQHADALYRDSDGLLWVGTRGDGLRLIDGDRVVNFSVADGLFDDVIYGIEADDHGRLWMACSKGIFSVARADLQDFAAGKIRSFVSTPYSPLDVLRTIECQAGVEPVVAKAKDGRLWFSTIRGLIVVDPNHLDRRFLPPAAAIEDVTVDGVPEPGIEFGTLPSARNNVEFRYTGVSFVAPNRITFRYRLEGFDKDWVEAGPRRQAFYTNLPPGNFRFRIAACNPDNACNESPKVLAFSIAPRLYQRAWFFPLCIFGLALGGAAVYQLRIQRLRTQFDLILAERGRIARELHDTLIQGFSGITMAMQALASRLPSSAERRTLEDIVADAGDALREARQSLTGLRRQGPPSSLARSIAQTAKQLTESSPVRLVLDVDKCQMALRSEVEDNLSRIAQEAIRNAVRHAAARTLRVTLQGTAGRTVLSVKDDGVGFDAAHTAPADHYGLIGMKERATQMGADLLVTSVRGRGTTVQVVVGT